MSFCNSVLEWHAIPSEFLGRLVAATTESPWLKRWCCDRAARCSPSSKGTTNLHQNSRFSYCIKSNTRWRCNPMGDDDEFRLQAGCNSLNTPCTFLQTRTRIATTLRSTSLRKKATVSGYGSACVGLYLMTPNNVRIKLTSRLFFLPPPPPCERHN